MTDLLTTDQVAGLLGKSRWTVTRMVKDGRLAAAHRLPGATGALLFNRTDVEALLAEPSEGVA